MDPLLIHVPDRLATERLFMRPPHAGDGAVVNEAVQETIEALQRWMPWSIPTPTAEKTELWCRKSHSEFIARTQLPLLLFRKSNGEFVGSSGMTNIDWAVPRFEIGYWVRQSAQRQGLITEAVAGMTRFLFETLGAQRVEIRIDDTNERSWRVPERLDFQLDGILRNDSRTSAGAIRSTRVYSKIAEEATIRIAPSSSV